jgi:regulator of protease activity HflC (stomatin/prohibitin superfamily)
MFITVVPDGSAYVVERLGRYHRTLPPGLHVLVPVIDRVAFRYSLGPRSDDVSDTAITLDNIPLTIRSTLRWQIADAREAAYGMNDPVFYATTLIRTTQRAWIARHAWSDARESTRQLEADVARAAEDAAQRVGLRVIEVTVDAIDRVTT